MTGRRLLYLGLIAVIAICLSPVYGIWWASSVAEEHGCVLHEGDANPCIVDGEDIGDDLYTAFVSGWLLLVTLPVALVAGLVVVVLGLIDLVRWHRRRGSG